MMPTQHSNTSTVRFASSSDSPAMKPKRRRSRPKNGPVIVTQGPKPESMAKPRISPATAEALYRTGRMPRIGG